MSHHAQFAQQPRQPLASDRFLFRLAAFAFRQHVEFASMLVQFHLNGFPHLLPRQIQPFFLVLRHSSFRCPHQIKHLPGEVAHLRQQGLGRNAPVHHPHPPRLPIGLLDMIQKTAQGRAIARVAVHHFIRQRKAFRRDHQRNDHLQTVRPVIPTVPTFGFLNLFGLALEVRAGQVIKQHIKMRGK